jgi:hypothetical protein
MMGRFVAEVAAGSEGRVVRLLTKLGATDVMRLELGYVTWIGDEAWGAIVKQCRGVRAVLPVQTEEVEIMVKASSAGVGITVGETVRVTRGALALVGQITQLDHGKAKMLTSLFGRPTEVEVSIEEAQVVALPEAWR